MFISVIFPENINCDPSDQSQCFQFHFDQQTHDKKLVGARLWIHLQSNTNSSGDIRQRDITVSLPASHYGHNYILARKETYVQTGWVEIEILHRRHIMKLFNGTWNIIKIACERGCDGRSQSLGFIESNDSLKPLLSLTYSMKNRARRTSNASPRRCNPETGCCLKRLALTFAELNWNGYEPGFFRADYCNGTCTLSHSISASPRSQIITTLSRQQRTEIATQCCVPLEYENLSVVYRDTDRSSILHRRTIPNIRATRCGCVV